MPYNMSLSASIVVYHTPKEEVKAVIEDAINGGIDKVYIIDNSHNDSLRIIERMSDKIRYIHNANIGYGGAHNIAIREAIEAGASYHVVINPDISFDADVISKLREFADRNSDAGWIMPKVKYPDGRMQYLCKLLPSPADLIFRRFLPTSWGKRRARRFEMLDSEYDHVMNVPFLSGCFMFLRVSALKQVGLFDERFFMYGEDIDLSRRMHKSFKTLYYPDVTIIHHHEAASYKNLKMLVVHIRNIVRYFNKWGWFFDSDRRKINKTAMCECCGNR